MDEKKLQPAVEIKHGNAPEIQEVSISVRTRHEGYTKLSPRVDHEEERYGQSRPVSKTMTTKSTMTNDDDFDIPDESHEVAVENVPCVSPDSALGIDQENQTVFPGTNKDKVIVWKSTPRVHFPPPVEGNNFIFSPPPSGIRHKFPGSIASNITMECRFRLPEPSIDPTFCHKPDKTFSLHQNKPTPIEPLRVWPGYGGNFYFQPMEVQQKQIRPKLNVDKRSEQARSHATSIRTREGLFTPEHSYANSKGLSFYETHSLTDSKVQTNYTNSNIFSSKRLKQNLDLEYLPATAIADRKMSLLDKDYVLNMSKNENLHEDWAWISGVESLGTLRLDDPTINVVRQSTRERYSRKTIVEKVPHRFVFHKQDKKCKTRRRERMDSQSTVIAKYGRMRNYQQYALKENKAVLLTTKNKNHVRRDPEINRNTTGGQILRISGHRVNDHTIAIKRKPLVLSSPRFNKLDDSEKFAKHFIHVSGKRQPLPKLSRVNASVKSAH